MDFGEKGYKQGSVTQGKFVPEQETDYIFCTVGEEWASSEVFFWCYLCYLYWQNILFSRNSKKYF